ncbi:PEP-CTERM sorting domain-containing protein, partial [endosymbiont of Lamellibrachia barhami]|uniref:PEP-CTERM sorting domain-containing protein n=1 Tax=endosymbiont of Lamellibrachia barhami TaxID=205975 RepID=UPI0015B13302
NNVKHPLEWSAEMALVCAYDNTISYLGSVLWGWERLKSDPPVAKVPTFSATSGTLKKMVQLGHPNYQVVSNACCKVPEPSTLMLMSIGLVMLAYRRRGSL